VVAISRVSALAACAARKVMEVESRPPERSVVMVCAGATRVATPAINAARSCAAPSGKRRSASVQVRVVCQPFAVMVARIPGGQDLDARKWRAAFEHVWQV
jgi:hypothetical protein